MAKLVPAVYLLLFLSWPAAAEQPNIVFLLADDMGNADLGCFGSKGIKTPNLDQLASQGVRLTHCYAASPNCSPARTGILTQLDNTVKRSPPGRVWVIRRLLSRQELEKTVDALATRSLSKLKDGARRARIAQWLLEHKELTVMSPEARECYNSIVAGYHARRKELGAKIASQ